MFMYCLNNPVNKKDTEGTIAGVDDAIAIIIAVIGLAATATIGSRTRSSSRRSYYAGTANRRLNIQKRLVSAAVSIAIAAKRAREKATENEESAVVGRKNEKSTVIYRYGGTNPGNLTPRDKDKYTGLSFSTIPRPGAEKTTIETVNATGVLYALQDGPTHVSIRPVGASMNVWIQEESSSIWTMKLKEIVVKWDGK